MADRRRIERVNGLLRDEISALIAARIKDPRLRAVVSVTQVQTAADLRSARVYISVMGSPRRAPGCPGRHSFLRILPAPGTPQPRIPALCPLPQLYPG